MILYIYNYSLYIYISYIHIFQVFSQSQQSTATFFLCSPGRFSCRVPSSAALQTARWSNGIPWTKLCRGSHDNMWLKMGRISPNIWQFITEGYLFFRIFKDKVQVFLNYSCFSAFLLLGFFAFLLFVLFSFFAFPASLLFCFFASWPFYFHFFFFCSHVFCCSASSCSSASPLLFFTVSLLFFFFCFILYCLHP